MQACAWTGVAADDTMQQDTSIPGTDDLVPMTNVCMQVPENGVSIGNQTMQEGHAESSRMEEFGPVMVNMQYAGDSILASLSGNGGMHELEIGEEEEISSDQCNKSKSFTADNINSKDIHHINIEPLNMEIATLDIVVDLNDWIIFNATPSKILWEEPWSKEEDPGYENSTWNKIVQASKNESVEVNNEEYKQCYDLATSLLRNNENAPTCKFLDQYPSILEQLVKWVGTLLNPEHVVGMKRKSAPIQGQMVVATANTEAHLEIGTVHRKKKEKKSKNHKAMHQKSDGKGETEVDAEKMNDPPSKQPRKKYKIWSSKNRKPEKNLSKRKFLFNSNIVLPKVLSQPLGLAGFHCGTLKAKANKDTQEGRQRRRKIIGEFYKEAMEKEDNLMGSITNIISKSGNNSSKLLNSIKNMKSCKLSKFSAKLQYGNKGRNVEKEKGKGKINQQSINANHIDILEHSSRKQNQQEQGNTSSKTAVLGKGRNVEENSGRTVIGEKKQNSNKPIVSMEETANRFCLLDEDGVEIIDTTDNPVVGPNEDVIPEDFNAEWIKTQESNLDAKYNKQITPKQRIEAKKYVIDKLVPLTTVLSSWSILHLDRKERQPPLNQNEDVEEVESETDGTAEFMTEDIPRPPSTNMNATSLEPINHNVVMQPDHVMEKADTNPKEF
ncbi:hypothetical protein L1987_42309 [Smallanthus sonchifolius]|uniref:Uncharacterized protein n=1 Tax=Smallanthus sonchifolius TaxID=185202 RepID=A0ACB9GI87_9ASTR|nr:hypothetical protein L1987_42309 [Smallanthus sonchifolius]